MLLKKIILFVFTALFWTHGFTQEDSVRKVLIEPITFIPPDWPIEVTPRWDEPWNPFWDITYPETYSVFIQQCGEQFFDNGNLMIRCACNEDSVLHGKSVYWKKNGQISRVYWYQSGRVYSYKNYSEGKLSSVTNYRYDKDGVKRIHGKSKEYSNNKIVTEELYDFDNRIWRKEWFPSGSLKSESQYDASGNIKSYEVFDEKGRIIQSEYNENSKPIGTWITHDLSTNIKTIKKHIDGKVSTIDSFKDSLLISQQSYEFGRLMLEERFWENGQMSYQFTTDRQYDFIGPDGVQKSWDAEGNLTENYRVLNDHFIGKGFYTQQGATMIIEGPDEPNEMLPMIRWTIRDGDTVRMDYHRNSVSNRSLRLVTNYYKTLDDGRNVRNGRWYVYKNNFISYHLTYVDGIKHNRAVYYTEDGGYPALRGIEHYKMGVKTGTWETFKDSIREVQTYALNEKSGEHLILKFNPKSTGNLDPSRNNQLLLEHVLIWDTLLMENYKNDLLDGVYRDFYSNGTIKMEGLFVKEKKDGIWKIYHRNGTLFREATFIEGEIVKSWFEYAPNKRGKMKRKKVDSDINVLPETFASPTQRSFV